jgi:hypothetical protein
MHCSEGCRNVESGELRTSEDSVYLPVLRELPNEDVIP